MKPTRHLHPNPQWQYVPAEKTDIRKTFERARKELQRKHKERRDEVGN